MNLENIHLKEVFDGVVRLATEAHIASLSLDCARLQNLIQTARQVFKDTFKIRIGTQWYGDLSLPHVISARDNYDTLELSFGEAVNRVSFTYAFDEESGFWMCIFRPRLEAQDLLSNLILTQRLSSYLSFELNQASFKVVELANNLRKA